MMKRFLVSLAAGALLCAPLAAKAQAVDPIARGLAAKALSQSFSLPYTGNCASVSSVCFALQNPSGTNVFSVDKTGIITIPSSSYLLASGGNGKFAFINNNIPALKGPVGDIRLNTDGSLGLGTNVSLYADAANTLGLENGANSQIFNIYNTTDGTNKEYTKIGFGAVNAGQFGIAQAQAGTGANNKSMAIAAETIDMYTGPVGSAAIRWRFDQNGNLAGQLAGAYVLTKPTTTGNLATCNSGATGARQMVTDADQAFSSANFGVAVTHTTGTNTVPVVCDGTSWKIG